jgi:hypothetical protein
MGSRDNEQLHEVATEKSSGIRDNEPVNLATVNVDETLLGGDRALENLAPPLFAQPRDPAFGGECFETVKEGGQADDAVILARKASVFPFLRTIGACRDGWLLLRTYVRFFSSSILPLS